jgi:polysaccharide export outer membrane protein
MYFLRRHSALKARHKANSMILSLVLALLCSACNTKKSLVYFQGSQALNSNDLNKNYTPVFHTDDLLSITVGGLDADAVKPFNLPSTNINTNLSGYINGTPSVMGYLIDANGLVDFPVIGQIKLAGLDRLTATNLLKEKLQMYISNPIVNIRILNFKVTVLGEVKNPGTFNIPNERITLLEALGIAGDINITGVRKNVLVVRDVDGKKSETRIDLTSKDLFNSPVYYLNQNDLVYVEPNRAKANSSLLNASNAGIAISVVSLLVTAFALILK